MTRPVCTARISSRRVFAVSNTVLVCPPKCDLDAGHEGIHRARTGEQWGESWCHTAADDPPPMPPSKPDPRDTELAALRAEVERLTKTEADAWRIVEVWRKRYENKSERYEALHEAAKFLRDSGYDGPFIGEVCAPLFDALAALDGGSDG